jgi:hypothetical protein
MTENGFLPFLLPSNAIVSPYPLVPSEMRCGMRILYSVPQFLSQQMFQIASAQFNLA